MIEVSLPMFVMIQSMLGILAGIAGIWLGRRHPRE